MQRNNVPEKRPNHVYIPAGSKWSYSYLYPWLAQNGFSMDASGSNNAGLKYVLK